MKKTILIAGGTGLVGSRLLELIDYNKYQVCILTRSKKKNTPDVRYYEWNFDEMTIDHEALKADFIINLTGAGIADKRWTESRKKILIDSRVNSALLIKKGLEETGLRPKAYISSSAIGYYGDRSDEILVETSDVGKGFMAECCEKWENSAQELEPFVGRLIILRIGIVLSTKGGALPKILMTKSVGIYTYFGSGKQYYSWIHIDDLCQLFISNMEQKVFRGIYNAVGPEPLTNKNFTMKVKDSLGGIAALPAPSFGLRLVLGEMADVVLNSNRVLPERLNKEGYEFMHSTLKTAILDLVKREV